MEKTRNLHTIFRYAKEEAERLGNRELLPDHLVLGILRLGQGKAFELLMQAGVNPNELKRTLDARMLREPMGNLRGYSRSTSRIRCFMEVEAATYHAEVCGSAHLLLAILRERINFPAMYLENTYAVDYECIERIFPKPEPLPQDDDSFEADKEDDDELAELQDELLETDNDSPEEKMHPQAHIQIFELGRKKKGSKTSALDKYGRDLTEQARKGELDPVIGREVEIERVIQILSRRKKNNPILIGEPGVGKSAIVEGLALRIVEGKTSALNGKRIVSLDVASMVAGTTYRGQFEERMKVIINELHEHPEVILFIDEIHTIIGAGSPKGTLDAANILKPALARGEVQCVGATTTEEYRNSIEKDGALERRFQKVVVQPTTTEETLGILTQLSGTYALYHHVQYSPEALRACVQLTDRYVTDRAFPDKAIDALDEAGAYKRQHADSQDDTPVVSEEDIAYIVSTMSGVPVQRVAKAEGERLRQLGEVLNQRVIGQEKAVNEVVKAIQRSRMGLRDPRKPIGTFFFIGPTGVGKTHLVQCLAEEMFGNRDAVIRFDMSEYMEKHTVSLLVGAPPGYVAYEDGGKLTEAVRRKPYSIVLFDEIEKAHPDIFNILLQVMDEGRLTDRQGHTVDFKNTIIILTGNVGTRQLTEMGNGIGFGADSMDEKTSEHILMKALQRTFPPEFVNRLDDVIVFHSLDDEALARILSQELRPLEQRLEAMGYKLRLKEETRKKLLEQSQDKRYGARPIKRAIQTLVEDPITDILLSNSHRGKTITV